MRRKGGRPGRRARRELCTPGAVAQPAPRPGHQNPVGVALSHRGRCHLTAGARAAMSSGCATKVNPGKPIAWPSAIMGEGQDPERVVGLDVDHLVREAIHGGTPDGKSRPHRLSGAAFSPPSERLFKSAAHFGPGNSRGFTGKNPPRSLLDFLCPSSLDIGRRFGRFVQAGQQLSGNVSPFAGGQLQGFAEQLFGARCHRLSISVGVLPISGGRGPLPPRAPSSGVSLTADPAAASFLATSTKLVH